MSLCRPCRYLYALAPLQLPVGQELALGKWAAAAAFMDVSRLQVISKIGGVQQQGFSTSHHHFIRVPVDTLNLIHFSVQLLTIQSTLEYHSHLHL